MGVTASSRTAAVNSWGRFFAGPGLHRLLAVASALAALALPARAADDTDPALRDARAVAARRPDFLVLTVSGRSMQPFFDGGTVIVVRRIDSRRLRVGMIAVYVNRSGKTVVHRVVAAADGGWRVQGYNNSRADRTIVNDRNLLGVVYATFLPLASVPPRIAGARPPEIATAHAAPAE